MSWISPPIQYGPPAHYPGRDYREWDWDKMLTLPTPAENRWVPRECAPVKAIQYTGHYGAGRIGVIRQEFPKQEFEVNHDGQLLLISPLGDDFDVEINPGDYVVERVGGEVVIVDCLIFEATYEPA